MSKEQLVEHYNLEVEDDGYIGMGVYNFGECLYEFGKYTDFKPPKGSTSTFFKNKELNKLFTEEHDFCIVTKEFLEYIINSYKTKVSDYYNSMMNPLFGNKYDIYSKEKPSNFLNSIKVEYKHPENDISFDFYKITQEEQNALYKIIEHIRSMRLEWTALTPFNLEQGDSITSSWKYEYGIFELVRIYKSFDWKKNVMIYYGY
jgi:hypothetical protein